MKKEIQTRLSYNKFYDIIISVIGKTWWRIMYVINDPFAIKITIL